MNKENITKTYIVIAPDGEELEITNLAQFCRDKELHYACMLSIRDPKKRLKSHKGYKIL